MSTGTGTGKTGVTREQLIQTAVEMRRRAYAPYSRFTVGAALESGDGRVFTGCNVENAAYGCCICAERTALVKAVSEGVTDFRRIAVAGGSETPCTPCGVCRQMLWEFAPALEVLMVSDSGEVAEAKLSELLPGAFRLTE